MNRQRDKQINFRLSSDELEIFNKNVEKSKLKKSEYLRRCILEKEIIVIDDLKELVMEMKILSSNMSNMLSSTDNKSEVKELMAMKQELNAVWKEVVKSLRRVND
ncbi:MAG: plasmid mobilization relaxosome protein MobC [Inconstantimicrobium porci]|uniref:Plasmid mobilization relaxosome protein MobC n=1 Tax=Inconstantimicrobium porci TaxID=2652291 RepID=A0A7X2T086_9CLOT|nr:plasmid mobilization relaxosome protein MobC [Inconstantimicrobium porci]MDD6770988.1 plasmid mobilization relaxosome protein MobC [Inconstantimicrobium porci]MDY5912988.1 plasmid mobilization relaxosome protein MobC [Inconstantimicrobium porci]MSR89925.1 plasmid mobilization relaxosome protein MobC [Inconstantimicrobium porci]